jgi:hypothetical protein
VAGFDSDIFSGEVDKAERMNIVDRFQDPNSNTFVMLVSTMAGGVGLNLTAVRGCLTTLLTGVRQTRLSFSIPAGVSRMFPSKVWACSKSKQILQTIFKPWTALSVSARSVLCR